MNGWITAGKIRCIPPMASLNPKEGATLSGGRTTRGIPSPSLSGIPFNAVGFLYQITTVSFRVAVRQPVGTSRLRPISVLLGRLMLCYAAWNPSLTRESVKYNKTVAGGQEEMWVSADCSQSQYYLGALCYTAGAWSSSLLRKSGRLQHRKLMMCCNM